MPELPEVETVRRTLEPHLVGARIAKCSIDERKILRSVEEIDVIDGQTVLSLDRRGKYLVIELNDHHLIFHLGMTGQLTIRDPRRPDSAFERHPVTGLETAIQHGPDRHTHFHVCLSDGRSLLFRDTRKFGRVFIIRKDSGSLPGFFAARKLGLEPFSSGYELSAFLALFGKRKLRIKSLLLNQSFVAGVGNIYADEALFEAGIHPARRTTSLRRSEKESLFQTVRLVLERGIQNKGTTFRDFIDGDGREGTNRDELFVYGRSGEPCVRCGTSIKKIVVSQRGTHFCPTCQPRRGRRTP